MTETILIRVGYYVAEYPLTEEAIELACKFLRIAAEKALKEG